MIKFDQWWLPDNERHMQGWMEKKNQRVEGRLTYQFHKYAASVQYCKLCRVAVDVGAHVGFFSYWLARDFTVVHAFEPVSDFRDCFRKNVNCDTGNMLLHSCALGSSPGRVSMLIPKLDGGIDSGGTHVSGDGDIDMVTLDSFGLEVVDYLKIDAEGFEDKIIAGARDTLLRCKPCVMVEQKQKKLSGNFGIAGTPAVDMLRDMGAVLRREMGGDYILSWPE